MSRIRHNISSFDPAAPPITSTISRARSPLTPEQEVLSRVARAKALLVQNQKRRALCVLFSEGLAPTTPDAFATLQDLHPTVP